MPIGFIAFCILQVLLAQDAAERDAAAVLPPELSTPEYQTNLELPPGCQLTAEQVSGLRTMMPVRPHRHLVAAATHCIKS